MEKTITISKEPLDNPYPEKRPTSWYEVGELHFPNEDAEFYKLFAVYWELRAHMENLETEVFGCNWFRLPDHFPGYQPQCSLNHKIYDSWYSHAV